MFGSVNAARGHFQIGGADLMQAHLQWGAPTPEDSVKSEDHHQPDAIKQVVEWTAA